MAVASGIGVTSLPNNRDKLFERIQQSSSSFEFEATAETGSEYYMFVLESAGEVVGTASISACAGFDEPFYSYRSETFVHASRTLKVNNRVHVLNICHDLTGMVQLCGFYADTVLEPLAADCCPAHACCSSPRRGSALAAASLPKCRAFTTMPGSRHSGMPLAAASSIWISCRWSRLLSATAKPSLPS
jgi:hypothetical protein